MLFDRLVHTPRQALEKHLDSLHQRHLNLTDEIEELESDARIHKEALKILESEIRLFQDSIKKMEADDNGKKQPETT